MLEEKKRAANIGIGGGILLEVVAVGGLTLTNSLAAALLALLLILVSAVLFAWGCWSYAQGKGYPGALGLIGLTGLIGLIVLVVLPDKLKSGTLVTGGSAAAYHSPYQPSQNAGWPQDAGWQQDQGWQADPADAGWQQTPVGAGPYASELPPSTHPESADTAWQAPSHQASWPPKDHWSLRHSA